MAMTRACCVTVIVFCFALFCCFCFVLLCRDVWYCVVFCFGVLCRVVFCFGVLYCVVLCCAVLCCVLLYCVVLCCAACNKAAPCLYVSRITVSLLKLDRTYAMYSLTTLPRVQKVQRLMVWLEQVLNWKRPWPIFNS